MRNPQPIFNPATHYRIEVRGRVDVKWLQSFESSVEIVFEESKEMEAITVITVNADQSAILGLVRRLHDLGMTILQIQIISEGRKD